MPAHRHGSAIVARKISAPDHNAAVISVTPMVALTHANRNATIPCPYVNLGQRRNGRQSDRRSGDTEYKFPHRILLQMGPEQQRERQRICSWECW
jgi:hypothetical protein